IRLITIKDFIISMGSKGWIYLLLALIIVLGIVFLPKLLNNQDHLKPDFYLDNSKVYLLREYDYERSHEQLKKAITAMRNLENDLDEESKAILETSIRQLEIVLEEIETEDLVKSDMNIAYAKALDALTYAEIKVSEHLLEENAGKEAIIALKYGMVHLRNAIKYSDSEELVKFEMHIYEELDSLIESNTIDHDQLKAKLDQLLEELDYIVEETDSII
ncbi:MAG: hypothetical protein WBA74_04870, partial [Cyclobacteriaceae bacterium]